MILKLSSSGFWRRVILHPEEGSPKRYITAKLHCATTQKTSTWFFTAVENSNVTSKWSLHRVQKLFFFALFLSFTWKFEYWQSACL